jgi:hypothetical protein
MPLKDYKKIMEERKKHEKHEKQRNKTSINIVKTIKDRKRVEIEILSAVRKQMGYWKTQIENTDPEKDKERYNEIKKNIEMEKAHIKKIREEIDRITKEIKMEEEHRNS